LLGINFNKIKGTKDDLFKFLNKKKIFPQYHYKPIYKFYFFKGKVNKKFLGAEEYHKNFLSLPIHYNLSKKDQSYIIKNVKTYLKLNLK